MEETLYLWYIHKTLYMTGWTIYQLVQDFSYQQSMKASAKVPSKTKKNAPCPTLPLLLGRYVWKYREFIPIPLVNPIGLKEDYIMDWVLNTGKPVDSEG